MSSLPTSATIATASSAHRPQAARRWLNVGVFLVALAGVGLVLDAALPMPDAGEVSEKLAFFARHKDEFEAVFIGSSRVCRQVMPDEFDARVQAATGRPMRSFNLGAPSMFLPESLTIIDRVLAQRPARLRWMFIELDDPRPRVEEHAGLVRREVYWHGLGATALVCVNILSARGIHKRDRVAMLAHQWALFGRRWTHLGRGQEWLASKFQTTDRDDATDASLGPAGDGFSPYFGTLGEAKSPGKDAGGDRRTFEAAAAALRAGNGQGDAPTRASTLLRWLLAAKGRALRARGVEPLFVIAPVTTAEEEFYALAKEGTARPLFAFNAPTAYPELYDANLRADTMHLNERGARLFTRLLAERFVAQQAAGQPR